MSHRINAKTLVELFAKAAEQYRPLPCVASRNAQGDYVPVSYGVLYDMAVDLATALIDLGLSARENVGLLSDNRMEWLLADMAVQLCGAADVPRGTDISHSEVDYILNHADCRFVFVEHEAMLTKLTKCRPRLPRVEQVIVLDRSVAGQEGVLNLYGLMERGKRLRASGDLRAQERVAGVRPEDLFTVIYTSGTTGQAKGVMLTHAAIISQIRNVPVAVSPRDRMLSILPIWHCYERMFQMVSIASGSCTYYTNVRTIVDDLRKVRPTLMTSAPRLWESLYLKILHRVHAGGLLKRTLFGYAYFCSRMLRSSAYFLEGRWLDMTGRSAWKSAFLGFFHSLRYAVFLIPYLIGDGLVLRRLRNLVGGCMRGTVSGGGALPIHVDEFFNYIGIPVLEGYGLTEACPVVAVRTWKKRVIGSVGPAYPNTEIRIVDLANRSILYPDSSRPGGGRGLKGEIHVRGPQLMAGYHKNPEATDQVLRDGWLVTGDVGMVTYNDCLKIVGRCKETIVLLSGENVEPSPIEYRLSESDFISQCMVVGQDQKHLAALIIPALETFQEAGVKVGAAAELIGNRDAERLLAREIKSLVNSASGFRHYEQIHSWRMLPKPFAVGEELTATYKLKRHVITEKYSDVIAGMFPQSRPASRREPVRK